MTVASFTWNGCTSDNVIRQAGARVRREDHLLAAGGDDPVNPGDLVVEEVRDPPLLVEGWLG